MGHFLPTFLPSPLGQTCMPLLALPATSSPIFSQGIFPNEILACFIPFQHLFLRPALMQVFMFRRVTATPHTICCCLAILASAPGRALWVQGLEFQKDKTKQRETPKTHLATSPLSLAFLFKGSFSNMLNPGPTWKPTGEAREGPSQETEAASHTLGRLGTLW